MVTLTLDNGNVRFDDQPGFNAQNPMLDEYMKKYKLEDKDWRPEKPWYEK